MEAFINQLEIIIQISVSTDHTWFLTFLVVIITTKDTWVIAIHFIVTAALDCRLLSDGIYVFEYAALATHSTFTMNKSTSSAPWHPGFIPICTTL